MNKTPDINKMLPNGSSSRGAQMGRMNRIGDNFQNLYLQRLQWEDYDYDKGGAYWGNSRDGTSMWCAFTGNPNELGTMVFVRAKTRKEAAELVDDLLPEEPTFINDPRKESQ